MSTKVTIIGEGEIKPKNKAIEFRGLISFDNKPGNCSKHPSEWKNIELIIRGGYNYKYDIMFGYDDRREGGFLYYGNFNDGIVENNQ